jgi:hypothetical protein
VFGQDALPEVEFTEGSVREHHAQRKRPTQGGKPLSSPSAKKVRFLERFCLTSARYSPAISSHTVETVIFCYQDRLSFSNPDPHDVLNSGVFATVRCDSSCVYFGRARTAASLFFFFAEKPCPVPGSAPAIPQHWTSGGMQKTVASRLIDPALPLVVSILSGARSGWL